MKLMTATATTTTKMAFDHVCFSKFKLDLFSHIIVTRCKQSVESLPTMALCEWWIKDDCCGVFCGVTTNILLSYAAFVQFYFVLGPYYGYLHPMTLFYLCLTLMAALCHARTQFTNPGAVPLDNDNSMDLENQALNPSNKQRRFCKHCKQYKPREAHHCSTCHRCIIRMDHHCPWVNNCVAMFNQKFFVLFCVCVLSKAN